ncbi:MAG: hypothetical protein PHE01_12150 [Methanosarcina sp.]|nr:hypothetical protein [Methanosarcina sp.]
MTVCKTAETSVFSTGKQPKYARKPRTAGLSFVYNYIFKIDSTAKTLFVA